MLQRKHWLTVIKLTQVRELKMDSENVACRARITSKITSRLPLSPSFLPLSLMMKSPSTPATAKR